MKGWAAFTFVYEVRTGYLEMYGKQDVNLRRLIAHMIIRDGLCYVTSLPTVEADYNDATIFCLSVYKQAFSAGQPDALSRQLTYCTPQYIHECEHLLSSNTALRHVNHACHVACVLKCLLRCGLGKRLDLPTRLCLQQNSSQPPSHHLTRTETSQGVPC